MVVDALDLLYQVARQDNIIISGDSDFSPLVPSLRENNKVVIGVGSELDVGPLIANCDEFIFYDDLVREKKRPAARKPAARASAGEPRSAGKDVERGRQVAAEERAMKNARRRAGPGRGNR
jgi:hypothetical protein